MLEGNEGDAEASAVAEEAAREADILQRWKAKWPADGNGTAPIRSLHWKLCLSQLSPLKPTKDGQRADVPSRRNWVDEVRQQRRKYASQRASLLCAPDGTYPNDLTPPSKEHEEDDEEDRLQREQKQQQQQDLDVNNPLSPDFENPWNAYLESLTKLEQIQNDVLRTFPEDVRFRGQDAQKLLTRILFVWATTKENSEIGYRQGMHELAAAIFVTRFGERVKRGQQGGANDDDEDAALGIILDNAHVEHDTYTLFAGFMQHTRAWYVWNRPADMTPIVERCQAIDAIVATVDPHLAQHLQLIGMETQLFALRWLRLLFLREFPLNETLDLWDDLLVRSPTLRLVDEVCVAMLIRIRHELLAASDYSEALMVLLKYPRPMATRLLVQQASSLFHNPSQITMQACVKENHELLGTPPFAFASSSSIDSSSLSAAAAASSSSISSTAASNPYGALSDLARGFYSQSTALGINRALQSAIQRGVEAAGALAAEDPRRSSSGVDGFPPSMHTNRYVPRQAKGTQQQQQLDMLRASNLTVAAALSTCIESLERHYLRAANVAESASDKDEKGKRDASAASAASDKERDLLEFMMSLTAVKHARDVLTGSASEFDGAILAALKQHQQQQCKQPDEQQNGPATITQEEPKKSSSPVRERPMANRRAFARLETEHQEPNMKNVVPSSSSSNEISQASGSRAQPTQPDRPAQPAPRFPPSTISPTASPSSSAPTSASSDSRAVQASILPRASANSSSSASIAVSAVDDPLGVNASL